MNFGQNYSLKIKWKIKVYFEKLKMNVPAIFSSVCITQRRFFWPGLSG